MCGRKCTEDCAKSVVVIFCGITFVFGVGCLAAGIWAHIDSTSLAGALSRVPQDEDESATEAVDAPSLLEQAQYVLIAGGGATVIISIIGCIGVCRMSKPIIIFFASIVMLCLLLELAAGIIVIFFREAIDDHLKEYLYDALDEYETGIVLGNQRIFESEDNIEEGWDISQITLECCGVNSYLDWQRNQSAFSATYHGTFCGETINNDDPLVPLSCCKTTNSHRYPENLEELYFVNITGCLSDPTPQNANLEGCYEEIKDKMRLYTLILIIVSLAVGAFEIGVVIASFYLICKSPGKAKD